jgi:sugar/nucleoside kinase (ribokinase family)
MPVTICVLRQDTEFDVLTLGECMIRLSPPGHQRIELTPVFEAFAGGGEYNVSYALARYGMRTGWVSRLVDNPLGHFIKNHARASGMDISEVVWIPYDGSGRADRIGLNFTEVGMGVRASVTLYDRGHTAVAHMKPGDVDWKRIFGERGVRWFHTGGIFAALSDGCAEVTIESMKAAHEAGTIVSYDLNFRSKLWSSKKAIEVTGNIIPYVDVLIGNEEDFQKVLGFTVEGTDANLKSLPVEGYRRMVAQVVKKYPGDPGSRDDAARGGERAGEQLVGHHVLRRDILRITQVHEPGNRRPRRGGGRLLQRVRLRPPARDGAAGVRGDGSGARSAAPDDPRRHEHGDDGRAEARDGGRKRPDQALTRLIKNLSSRVCHYETVIASSRHYRAEPKVAPEAT